MCIAKRISYDSISNKIEPNSLKENENGSHIFSISNQAHIEPNDGPYEPTVLAKNNESILKQIGKDLLKYLMGFWLCIYINEALKLLVSEPRPYFMEICNPDLSSGICSQENRFE